jgi:hypothetical protein
MRVGMGGDIRENILGWAWGVILDKTYYIFSNITPRVGVAVILEKKHYISSNITPHPHHHTLI